MIATSDRGYAYVMHSAERNIYKIGMSRSPDRRLMQLKQIEAIPDLMITHKISCYDRPQAYEVEYLLHHTYRAKKLAGEWFQLDKSDIRSLRRMHTASVVLQAFLPAWYKDMGSKSSESYTQRETEMMKRYKIILDNPLHPIRALINRRAELEAAILDLERRLSPLRSEVRDINVLMQRLIGS